VAWTCGEKGALKMGGLVSSEQKAPPRSLIILDPVLDETTPDYLNGNLLYPANYGFEGKQRKERVMVATPEELESAKVPAKMRDYCAHKWIGFEKCKRDAFPFVYRCHHEKHDYEHCQYEDYLIRMKDFERERRLLYRKQRKDAKARKAEAAHADD